MGIDGTATVVVAIFTAQDPAATGEAYVVTQATQDTVIRVHTLAIVAHIQAAIAAVMQIPATTTATTTVISLIAPILETEEPIHPHILATAPNHLFAQVEDLT